MTGVVERADMYLTADHQMVLVPADVAGWLVSTVDLRRRRQEVRGNDLHRDAVLMALTLAGMKHLNSLDVSDRRKSAEVAPESEWMNVQRVADRLNVGPHRITQLIRSKRLGAEKVGRVWRIHATELDRYLAARVA